VSPKNSYLRNKALQIAAQLPENREEALTVLTFAADIIRNLYDAPGPVSSGGSGSLSGNGNGNGGPPGSPPPDEGTRSATVVGLFREQSEVPGHLRR
jgi:hypothetical protein